MVTWHAAATCTVYELHLHANNTSRHASCSVNSIWCTCCAANSSISHSGGATAANDSSAASLQADQVSALAQNSAADTDVAAQLQQAQQHSQQQAASIKQQNEVATSQLDSGTASNTAADSSLAAVTTDGAALTAANSVVDPALQLQQAQKQQSQETAAMKQHKVGTAARLQAAQAAGSGATGTIADSAVTGLDPRLMTSVVDDPGEATDAAVQLQQAQLAQQAQQAQQQQAAALQQNSATATVSDTVKH